MVHTLSEDHAYPTCYVLQARNNKGANARSEAIPIMTMLLAAVAGEVARADIYDLVDPTGVTPFSNVPVDGRYRLLVATPAGAQGPFALGCLRKTVNRLPPD